MFGLFVRHGGEDVPLDFSVARDDLVPECMENTRFFIRRVDALQGSPIDLAHNRAAFGLLDEQPDPGDLFDVWVMGYEVPLKTKTVLFSPYPEALPADMDIRVHESVEEAKSAAEAYAARYKSDAVPMWS